MEESLSNSCSRARHLCQAGFKQKKKGLTSLFQQTPPTAVAALRMPSEWAGVFVCPYFGCGEVASDLIKLSEHCNVHNGAAPGTVTFPFPSATLAVEPELVERALPSRDPHALSQEGVADFDLLVSVLPPQPPPSPFVARTSHAPQTL